MHRTVAVDCQPSRIPLAPIRHPNSMLGSTSPNYMEPTLSDISASPNVSKVVAPKLAAAMLNDLWSPQIVGEVDDVYVKVAKVHGTLAWHTHEDEDELFFVLKGKLRIEMDAGVVELNEGEMFIIPKGIRHNPVAEDECHVMLIERKSTLHTGNVVTSKTKSIADQLCAAGSGGRRSQNVA